jgi:hypothetical protein
MIDVHRSVLLAVAAERKRMWGELQALKDETEATHVQLRRELEAALTQVRETRLEFLSYKQTVVRERERLAEITYERMLIAAQLAQFDPSSTSLH